MRGGGENQFVFPSIWEEKNKTRLIQYKTEERAAGSIKSVRIEVFDVLPDSKPNVVWSADLSKSSEWADAGFHTRTTGGVDANRKPNIDKFMRYKFLDTQSSGGGVNFRRFDARLIVTLKNNATLEATLKFGAKPRNIWYIEAGKTAFESMGKAYMWMIQKLEAGDNDIQTDPAKDDDVLYLGIPPPPAMPRFTLKTAFQCLPPRGTFRFVGHGLFDSEMPGHVPAGMIRLSANLGDPVERRVAYAGFIGPGTQAGAEGTRPNQPYVDLTDFFQSHGTKVYVIACWSADTSDEAPRSVITSFQNALAKSIGGGGAVNGYNGEFGIDVAHLPDVLGGDPPKFNFTGLSTRQIQRFLPVAAYDVTGEWCFSHTVTKLTPIPDDAFLAPANLVRMAGEASDDFDDRNPDLHVVYTFAITGINRVRRFPISGNIKDVHNVHTIATPGTP